MMQVTNPGYRIAVTGGAGRNLSSLASRLERAGHSVSSLPDTALPPIGAPLVGAINDIMAALAESAGSLAAEMARTGNAWDAAVAGYSRTEELAAGRLSAVTKSLGSG